MIYRTITLRDFCKPLPAGRCQSYPSASWLASRVQLLPGRDRPFADREQSEQSATINHTCPSANHIGLSVHPPKASPTAIHSKWFESSPGCASHFSGGTPLIVLSRMSVLVLNILVVVANSFSMFVLILGAGM